MNRIVIFGNSGSGKTTMARAVAQALAIPHLDLDWIAWDAFAVRRPLEASIANLDEYFAAHPQWVIEGCYADLIAYAAGFCTEMRFLNPGVDACVAHCLNRPWEAEKYASKEEQDAQLKQLVSWVREYDSREDEYGLARHRAVFDTFTGVKREYR